MTHIKANTSWNDRIGETYFTKFEIIKELPEVGSEYEGGTVEEITDAHIDKTSSHLLEEWSFHYIFVDDGEGLHSRYPVAVKIDWDEIAKKDPYDFVYGE